MFKAFPKNLKTTEIKKWADLQAQTLSPFSQGDRYAYLSKTGLHAWYTPTHLSGIPETAAQSPLPDGRHNIISEAFVYRQQWQNGGLTDCIATPISHTSNNQSESESAEIQISSPWAIERKLDKELKKPKSWLIIVLFLFLCGLCWVGAGYLIVEIQRYQVDDENKQLTQELGEKLAQQTQLRDQQMALSVLHTWQQEQGFFPESFGIIAAVLNEQGIWQTNQVTWQNKSLELEFVSSDVDITALIGNLEKINTLTQVNIRPHNAENTWILEAQIK
ncbi:hypothetical protein [Neptunicella sp. SCSIO 80796]|uniref:hypothetical protein n=1 Tax=Neptunicella plasticusilytica TaxID=3117012 RepID=UPI003A4DD903